MFGNILAVMLVGQMVVKLELKHEPGLLHELPSILRDEVLKLETAKILASPVCSLQLVYHS